MRYLPLVVDGKIVHMPIGDKDLHTVQELDKLYKDFLEKQMEDKKNPKLSWLQLQEMFGKPVYYVNYDNPENKGWIILYELHITERGQFVIGTDECCFPLSEYKFYRREFA